MGRTVRQSTLGATCPKAPKALCFRTHFKDFKNTAEILVGESKTPYLIHTDLITTQSPFFAAALNGRFAESQSQTVTLADIEENTFDHVILWFYQNRLEPLAHWFKDGKPTYFELLELYAVADQLDIEDLRNAIVDRVAELAEQTNSVPTPTDTWILYDTIRENSPLRTLILDLFAFKKTDNLIATHPDEWHPGFFRDLVCKLKKPGVAALRRHDLGAWQCGTWMGTKACEVCRQVLKPGVANHKCFSCEKGFCAGCVVKGVGSASMDWSVAERECKPWLRGMCGYHEHVETERCDS